jgi:hypothetical protein
MCDLASCSWLLQVREALSVAPRPCLHALQLSRLVLTVKAQAMMLDRTSQLARLANTRDPT